MHAFDHSAVLRGHQTARLGAGNAERVHRPVGIECKGESYGLLIDAIGEVLKLSAGGREDNPVNLDPQLARVSAGVPRLDGSLPVLLDFDRILDGGVRAEAA